MAETTASIGGYMASGYRRVAGVQIYINYLKPARLGDRIEAKVNPIRYLPRRVLGQGPAAGRGALDPAGGGARLRPTLGCRPPRWHLLDRPTE
ncbi:uncharacterized protein LOC119349143 isoform X2 [Triticum dicoccoides]|uniref:uncharacterized protein LOC119349143 isoform X2 n=1 Tax=Triticum dicoccoides TaxID=85692 RepID=UPI0018905074|nr:uncharacterized protein LOC119349143 isoform X2 [Triticum dicoccoides]